MAKPRDDLDELFQTLKSLLVEYETPRPGTAFQGRSASDSDFDLWSTKKAVDGRPRDEVFFAGIRKHKTSVGFYFFPVYTEPSLGTALAPPLRKLLKGKSCFHVTSLEGGRLQQIRHALGLGVDCYLRRGWL